MKRINLLTACLTIVLSTMAYSMNNGPARDQGDEAELPFQEVSHPELMQTLRAQRPQPIVIPAHRQLPSQRPPLRGISHIEANSPASSRGTPVTGILSIATDNTGAETPQRIATPPTPLRITPGTPTQVPPEITRQATQIIAARNAGQLTADQALAQMGALLGGAIPPLRSQSQNIPPNPNINRE